MNNFVLYWLFGSITVLCVWCMFTTSKILDRADERHKTNVRKLK